MKPFCNASCEKDKLQQLPAGKKKNRVQNECETTATPRHDRSFTVFSLGSFPVSQMETLKTFITSDMAM